MMDLIDRAALLKTFEDVQKTDPMIDNGRGYADNFLNDAGEPSAEWFAVEDLVYKMPTVEAVPMRRTKPVMGVSRDQLRNWWQCGNCESVIDKGDRYCRGCGAEVEWDSAIT